MKNILYTLAISGSTILLSCSGSSSTMRTENFKVLGNCGMCEKTIENATKNVAGVNSADWNVDSKMIAVEYDESKTSLNIIKQMIAEAGYDSETHKATEEAYNSLHGCCQYER